MRRVAGRLKREVVKTFVGVTELNPIDLSDFSLGHKLSFGSRIQWSCQVFLAPAGRLNLAPPKHGCPVPGGPGSTTLEASARDAPVARCAMLSGLRPESRILGGFIARA